MEEAEKMCDRVGIIDKGEIISEGTLSELKSNYGKNETILFTAIDGVNDTAFLNNFSFTLLDDHHISVESKNVKNDLPELVKKFSAHAVAIDAIDVKSITLETIFLNLTGRKLRD